MTSHTGRDSWLPQVNMWIFGAIILSSFIFWNCLVSGTIYREVKFKCFLWLLFVLSSLISRKHRDYKYCHLLTSALDRGKHPCVARTAQFTCRPGPVMNNPPSSSSLSKCSSSTNDLYAHPSCFGWRRLGKIPMTPNRMLHNYQTHPHSFKRSHSWQE